MITRLVPRLAMLVVLVAAFASGSASVAAQVTPPATNSGNVTVNAALQPVLTLSVAPAVASFGIVSPGGVGGLTDAESNNSYFLAVGPVVTVVSNSAWQGTILGTHPTTPSTTLTIEDGSLHYTQFQVTASIDPPPAVPVLSLGDGLPSVSNIGSGTVPTTYEAADDLDTINSTATTWIEDGDAGLSSYAQLYALRVLNDDQAVDGGLLNGGSAVNFSVVITYSATQGAPT